MANNLEALHKKYNAKLVKLAAAREEVRSAKRDLDQALEAQRRGELLESLGLAPRAAVANAETAVSTQRADLESEEAE